jgi:tetratricopeptide (TPR) repeat protein
MADEPDSVAARLHHARLVYLRARVTGDIDEMARAASETAACTRLHPESADAWLALASQEQTLHRFAEARAALARARALGVEEDRIVGLERELDWNAGLWGPAAESIREEARRAPTSGSLTRLARLEHDLGRTDEADALYALALSRIDDTGPIQVAMIEVQRGTNLAEAGRFEEAVATFRSAAQRLPRYIAAREHLAEALHHLGQDDEAAALYEEIVKVSTDPEFMGALAAIHRSHGRVAEADALRARATKRYEELLAKYPEAMAWHAAEYFAGEGNDPARARALLTRNAELRPNPDSLDALARVLRSTGDRERADELARRAASTRASAQPRS